MIDITKFIPKDTFLSEWLKDNNNYGTSVLGDLWTGVYMINSLIQDKYIHINEKDTMKNNILLCFLSQNPENYKKHLQDIQANCSSIQEIDTKQLKTSKIINLILYSLTDIENTDLTKIRNHFLFERKYGYDKYGPLFLSGCFGSTYTDYFTILGMQNEKSCGMLAQTLPICCDKQKHARTFTEQYTTRRELSETYKELLRFKQTTEQFFISTNGLQYYNKYVTNRVREKGFYGQIIENIKDNYCLKLATILAFNQFFNYVSEVDIKNAINILNETCKQALNCYNENIYDESSKVSIEKALIKIKENLLQAGLNGMQHRSLFMKVHHDIDNETFRYIMNVLHELNLIEKLKVSHNSYIYRASDTLDVFNINNILGELKEF